jgi:RNA polymerase sigma-70 factor, ECF subfamily
MALRIVRRPEIAADVLQETFLQIWQKAAAFSAERGAGAAWLTGIVRFRALDAVRKAGREIPSDDPALGDEALEPDVIEKIGASAEAEALRRCLKLLDQEQQRCILLAFVDGLSHSEVAERINAPLGSVKSWIRRGLLSLRRCLEP